MNALLSAKMAGSGSPNPTEKAPTSASRSVPDPPTRRCHILIVEDNKADAALIRRALARAGVSAELHELNDGDKAIRFLEKADAALIPALQAKLMALAIRYEELAASLESPADQP